MENLVSLVYRLQRACTDNSEETALPALCSALTSIAGAQRQGCGNSSGLGSIVGKDFLPRRPGIVTRRPLLLQLHRLHTSRECAESEHLRRRRSFTDFGTWKLLRAKFLTKYSSPNMNVTKEAEITQFSHKMDESLSGRYTQYQLLRKSPVHGHEQQICQFYEDLVSNTRNLVDAPAEGSLMSRDQTSFGEMNRVDQTCCKCVCRNNQCLEEKLNEHVAMTNAKLNELVSTVKELSSHVEMVSMQVEQLSKILLESLNPKSPGSSESGDCMTMMLGKGDFRNELSSLEIDDQEVYAEPKVVHRMANLEK